MVMKRRKKNNMLVVDINFVSCILPHLAHKHDSVTDNLMRLFEDFNFSFFIVSFFSNLVLFLLAKEPFDNSTLL